MASHLAKLGKAAGFPPPPWTDGTVKTPAQVAGHAVAIYRLYHDGDTTAEPRITEREVRAWTKVFETLIDDGVIVLPAAGDDHA